MYVKKKINNLVSYLIVKTPLFHLLKRLIKPKGYSLIFGGHNGTLFDDNSRAFAEFCAQHAEKYTVYWVYRNPELVEKIRSAGIRPLRHGRFSTEFRLAAADAAFFSHGWGDLSSGGFRSPARRLTVFLGHGVWGLKRIQRRGISVRRFSMTICVSETERAEKSKLYEVAADRVIPSGLPKHSRLLRMSSSTRQDAAPKKVLYAPTWRDWLQHQPSDLAVDAFFAGFERLLAVRPNADEHGERYHITFLLHKNVSISLQPHLDRFDEIPGVSIAFPDEDISSIVAESDYLISDYSAIIWDFIIQKKRVARFLHDQMIYDYITGEFDFVGDTLNEITFTDEVAVWQEVFSPDNSGKIESLAGEYLGYSDENSCDRLMQAVDQAISDRRRGIFIDA